MSPSSKRTILLLIRIYQTFVTPLAKSVVDETSELFRGVYMGIGTPSAEAKRKFEEADLTVHIGRFPSDSNCGGFTQKLAPKVIGLHPHYAFVGAARWDTVSFIPILQKLVHQLASRPKKHSQAAWCPPVSLLCFYRAIEFANPRTYHRSRKQLHQCPGTKRVLCNRLISGTFSTGFCGKEIV